MRTLRVASICLNQIPLDWGGNYRRITQSLARARDKGAGLILYPELSLTGYGCEDAFLGLGALRETEALLWNLIPETKGAVVAVGIPYLHHKALYDVMAVISDGHLLGLVPRQLLSTDPVRDQRPWFKAWPENEVVAGEIFNLEVPLGDLMFDVGGVRIGFEFCDSSWSGERPAARLARLGVDFLLNPAVDHFAFGRSNLHEAFVLEGARVAGAAYITANLMGNEAGRVLFDGGGCVASEGKIVARSPRMSFKEFEIAWADVDLDTTRTSQAGRPDFRPLATDPVHSLVRAEHRWTPSGAPTDKGMETEEWERGTRFRMEEFTRAVGLGLWDYFRKSKTKGFVINLAAGNASGGLACLTAWSLRRAEQEMGMDAIRKVLPQIPELLGVEDGNGFVERTLTTISMANGEKASALSTKTLQSMVQMVGNRHLDLDVKGVADTLADVLGKSAEALVEGAEDGLLHNLRERVRTPVSWLVANLEEKLLLSSVHRTEMSAGTVAMDGQMAGSLAPFAGVDQVFLRDWLEWMMIEGPIGTGAHPFLASCQLEEGAVMGKSAGSKHGGIDMVPFAVLEVIEHMAMRDRLPPEEVLPRLRARFGAEDPDRLRIWIGRFYRLWARHQWKKDRYAPSFHLDDEMLDPRKTGRLPLLSGGFVRELQKLEEGSLGRI